MDAIEDRDAGMLENADFADTDIPYDFNLPDRHYLDEARREEVSSASDEASNGLLTKIIDADAALELCLRLQAMTC